MFVASQSKQIRQIDGIAPTFAKKPTIRQEDDGERLLFECRILADPQPTVNWYHNGVPVVGKGRFQMMVDKDGNSYHVTLQIDDVTIEDAGKYKVTAHNELGESNATISLNFDSDDIPEEGAKPTFVEKPMIKQSDDGNKIIFECRLMADPPPSIEWYHKGKIVKEDARHKYRIATENHTHTVALEVANVKSEDGGEYKVVASNEHGEGHANITLNFEGDSGKPKVPDGKAPRFPKKPTIRQEGDALVLECILEAHPFPEISWFLGPKKIADGTRHKISKKETAKHTYLLSLEIRDPTTEDGGNYRCNAVNELGDSNANITLNLKGGEPPKTGDPPVFTEKAKIIPKDSGAIIVMECHVKSKTAPQFTWLHGSDPVKEDPHIKFNMVKEGTEDYVITLTITGPNKDDGGAYKCNIRNEHGEINGNLNLNIAAEETSTGSCRMTTSGEQSVPQSTTARPLGRCPERSEDCGITAAGAASVAVSFRQERITLKRAN
ncbi:twitchin [Ixodes scapularis]